MQLSFLLDAFLQLIPHRLSSTPFPLSPKAFVRQCKLTLPSLIVLLLSLTASGKRQGGSLFPPGATERLMGTGPKPL